MGQNAIWGSGVQLKSTCFFLGGEGCFWGEARRGFLGGGGGVSGEGEGRWCFWKGVREGGKEGGRGRGRMLAQSNFGKSF